MVFVATSTERDRASRRVQGPTAGLRVGEKQALSFGDDRFDLVTGFNSFFFAADMVAALRKAGRVKKPGETLDRELVAPAGIAALVGSSTSRLVVARG